MGLEAVRINVTTDGAGAGTGYSESNYLGLLFAVEWIDGDLADGVDAVLSITNTGSAVDQTLLTLTDANSDAWYYPRAVEDDLTGTDATNKTFLVVNGQFKLVVSSGGATKTGGCIAYFIK